VEPKTKASPVGPDFIIFSTSRIFYILSSKHQFGGMIILRRPRCDHKPAEATRVVLDAAPNRSGLPLSVFSD